MSHDQSSHKCYLVNIQSDFLAVPEHLSQKMWLITNEVSLAFQSKQGNRRLHFARAVHSRHPLPGRSHLQRQQRNYPFCCMMLW